MKATGNILNPDPTIACYELEDGSYALMDIYDLCVGPILYKPKVVRVHYMKLSKFESLVGISSEGG